MEETLLTVATHDLEQRLGLLRHAQRKRMKREVGEPRTVAQSVPNSLNLSEQIIHRNRPPINRYTYGVWLPGAASGKVRMR